MIINKIPILVDEYSNIHILKPVNSVYDDNDIYFKTKCGYMNFSPGMSPSRISKEHLIGNKDVCEKCITEDIKLWNH